jgi:site-specific DNA recombinase
VWQAAQQVLHSNQSVCAQKSIQPYLLRGLIQCALCGLNYSGIRKSAPQRDHYYHCNGRQFSRKLYGFSGRKCTGNSLNGHAVEALVWADIESFLRQPDRILEQLKKHVSLQDRERPLRQKELDEFLEQRELKVAERDRILGLFRRGRIDETTLDRQLDLIQHETAALQTQIDTATRLLSAPDRKKQLKCAAELLQALRPELEQPVSPELQRRLIEILVDSIEARTIERWGVPHSEVVIRYRFSPPQEAVALLWSRSHQLDNRNPGPEELHTLGDHLRRRRLSLKLAQGQAAGQLGVARVSLFNWEHDRQQPGVESMPAILRFLGYDPLLSRRTGRRR